MLASSRMIASSRSPAKPLPLRQSRRLRVSCSGMTGMSLRGVFGCGTRSIGERVKFLLAEQELEELLQALVLVQRGGRGPGLDHPGLERLHVRPGHRAGILGGVVRVRVGRLLGQVAAQSGGGDQVVVAGGLRMVGGAQGPVPGTQEPGPDSG